MYRGGDKDMREGHDSRTATKTILLKIGIISLPVFVYWAYQQAISHSGNLREFLMNIDAITLITLLIASPLIILGLSVYLSIKLWVRWIK